ncbi:3-hexulose-6-phosphate synthase [Neobacillus niacini]|uniref:3-hexulose-6-phosphate synthase n=1 Tax=Neobacillus niacini TaxID=86668 RepID=UPI002041DF18|nr:3-hexulose-6-phosphate synthase [Neobacillus niacini]MCM3693905.1 orotidine 5'-phosphate decarboxylase [Neobacillus niacini]
MKLQLALDTCNTEEALQIVGEVENSIDIVEIGTPMIIEYGMEPVRKVSEQYPNKLVIADTKIMDAGEFEADIAFNAGASIVSVMGITHDETIKGAVKAAKKANGKVLADMMCVTNLEKRAIELVELGVDYICVHTAHDVQATQSPFASLAKVQRSVGSERCAIAGGINEESINNVIEFKPEIVIVGNGITGQKNKAVAAKKISDILHD